MVRQPVLHVDKALQTDTHSTLVPRQGSSGGLNVAGSARIPPERSEFLRIELPVKSGLTLH